MTTSVSLKLKDFSKIGPITQQLADASVGKASRSRYTLDSTEEAKSKAVADAYGAPVPRPNRWPTPADGRSANSPMPPWIRSRTSA